MNALTVIDVEYTEQPAPSPLGERAPMSWHAHQAALQALANIHGEVRRFEKDCKAMDQYIKSGDFSMASERAQKRLRARGDTVREQLRQWHAKFDGRTVLPKP